MEENASLWDQDTLTALFDTLDNIARLLTRIAESNDAIVKAVKHVEDAVSMSG